MTIKAIFKAQSSSPAIIIKQAAYQAKLILENTKLAVRVDRLNSAKKLRQLKARVKKLEQSKAEQKLALLLENQANQLEVLKQKTISSAQKDCIKLVFKIAKKIFHEQLKIDKNLVASLVKKELEHLSTDKPKRIDVDQDNSEIKFILDTGSITYSLDNELTHLETACLNHV